MTVTNVGSTKKYSAGWDSIFSGKKGTKKPVASTAGKKSPRKKAKR